MFGVCSGYVWGRETGVSRLLWRVQGIFLPQQHWFLLMGLFVLELCGVSVGVAGLPLLHSVELCLKRGECIGLRGPSGLGKSTLLRAVCALDDPLEGRILFNSTPYSEVGWCALRRQVVLVEQAPVFLPGSLEKNLRLPFSYGAAKSDFPADRCASWLEQLGIEAKRMKQEAQSLSVGQRQRVALLRALLLDPAVLLLDEPTSGLDSESADKVIDLLGEVFQERNTAALLVGHEQQPVGKLCRRWIDVETFSTRAGVAGEEP